MSSRVLQMILALLQQMSQVFLPCPNYAGHTNLPRQHPDFEFAWNVQVPIPNPYPLPLLHSAKLLSGPSFTIDLRSSETH